MLSKVKCEAVQRDSSSGEQSSGGEPMDTDTSEESRSQKVGAIYLKLGHLHLLAEDFAKGRYCDFGHLSLPCQCHFYFLESW